MYKGDTKESKVVVFSYVVVAVIFLLSVISNCKPYDVGYLIALAILFIRYLISSKLKK